MSATVSLSFMPIRPNTSRISGTLPSGSGTPNGPSGLTGEGSEKIKHEDGVAKTFVVGKVVAYSPLSTEHKKVEGIQVG